MHTDKNPGLWLQSHIPTWKRHAAGWHAKQTAQPRQQWRSPTWPESRCSHWTPKGQDQTDADQLLYPEVEGTSWGDAEGSSAALTDDYYLCWVAGLHQTTPNRPRAILVFKGWTCCRIRSCMQRIVIPKTLQENLPIQLHKGHQGIEKTRGLAQEGIYWPNINDHISKMCKSCDTCQKFQSNNHK